MNYDTNRGELECTSKNDSHKNALFNFDGYSFFLSIAQNGKNYIALTSDTIQCCNATFGIYDLFLIDADDHVTILQDPPSIE